jgi:uncharacterized protein YqhQ
MKDKLPSYGGQAVIEGVLMRGKSSVAMANRAPNDEIIVHQEKLTGIYTSKLSKIPFLRGLIILWDSLGLGMRFLTLSANIQSGEEEKLEGPMLYLSLAISLTIGLGLFFLAPALIAGLFMRFTTMTPWVSNVLEGLLRLIILLLYMWSIGRIPDIKRVFMYHGAEHKTINAFEDGIELTPENVMQYSVEHPRCGTSFILTLVILSILIFTLLGPMPLHWRLISRILLIPVLAGLSYEYIRLLSKHLDLPIVSLLIKPNLLLQRLSTKEPTKDMLEVSVKALQTLMNMEQDQQQKTPL